MADETQQAAERLEQSRRLLERLPVTKRPDGHHEWTGEDAAIVTTALAAAHAEGRAEGLREVQHRLAVALLNTHEPAGDYRTGKKQAYANVLAWVRELLPAAPAGVAPAQEGQ